MKALTKSYAAKIESIKEALSSVRLNITVAGKLLVEMIEERDDTLEILVAQRVATLAFLEALEGVGRGEVNEMLLTDFSPAAQRALSQAMPIAEQQKLLTEHIPVVVRHNGGVRIEQKTVSEIKYNEAPYVIRDGKIQTTDEQIAILRGQDSERAKRTLRYEIDGQRIKFFHDSEFTYSELEGLIERIKPKAIDIQASIEANTFARA